MNRPERKVFKPSKYRTVDENPTEATCGSSMTTTVSGKDDSAFKSKIAALNAEITLLKDECDFLNKGIKKMKSAVPSAMSQIHTSAVPRPSAKIAALNAEITLLKDECDFLNKGIEKMKSAVPSAMSQIHTSAVPRPSAIRLPQDYSFSYSHRRRASGSIAAATLLNKPLDLPLNLASTAEMSNFPSILVSFGHANNSSDRKVYSI
ncbi:zinc finger protein 771-like [Labeo rohita]|uniref:Zinc finger protein 771-like n=1 Tax=Labeo rohita TaxID=84645 RepID=A0A498L6S4_LABRO|nr:zinc finger protein 771-like [Labeo rohita]